MSPRVLSALFLASCLAQLAYPASMIVGHEWTLRAGTPLRVRCQPVDPSDLLRGRYVRLRLETFTVPVDKPEAYLEKPTAYALLETDAAGFARLGGVRSEAPETGLYVSAEIRAVDREKGEVTLGLPFDRYYMGERAAPLAEAAYRRAAGEGDAFVVLRVRGGQAAIEELYIEGRPVAEFLAGQAPDGDD
jgi:uncharacterized membrane-anchored protein